jgi:hypothetical protein
MLTLHLFQHVHPGSKLANLGRVRKQAVNVLEIGCHQHELLVGAEAPMS